MRGHKNREKHTEFGAEGLQMVGNHGEWRQIKGAISRETRRLRFVFELPYQVCLRWISVDGTGTPTHRRRPKTIAAKRRRKGHFIVRDVLQENKSLRLSFDKIRYTRDGRNAEPKKTSLNFTMGAEELDGRG